MVRLRILTVDDWPLWRELRLAALREAPHAFTARLADWGHGGEERWRARLEAPATRNVAAFAQGTAVGMASGLSRDGAYELRSVWVSPRARGRGVGDLLLSDVASWAREHGATSLRLKVVRGNEAAEALYARNGFVAEEAARAEGAGERVMVRSLVP
ncbi:GNAT family N-acetyltransferase [Streptomyces xiaopingdaonensis]|uniref:GNAT family N-acetyltransferase n=1 Tax=Streptomyces xiaopingdaonensis TaxID=1565415 RepID=UPI0003122D4D|nr:GNAT family N-acetyltransferase [Streptomyces xiaopingdaonensis]